MKPPREHGFWVMLTLALFVGVCMAPSWQSVVFAALLGALSVGLAMWLGRRIRKSVWLQALAGPLLAAWLIPVGVVGGMPPVEIIRIYTPLALAFLSTTLSVQAILYRAQKKEIAAARARWGAVAVALLGAFGGLVLQERRLTLALFLCFFCVTALLVLQPSARRMKQVGLVVTVVQLGVALLLVLERGSWALLAKLLPVL